MNHVTQVISDRTELVNRRTAERVQPMQKVSPPAHPGNSIPCETCTRPGERRGRGAILRRVVPLRGDGQPIASFYEAHPCPECKGYGFVLTGQAARATA